MEQADCFQAGFEFSKCFNNSSRKRSLLKVASISDFFTALIIFFSRQIPNYNENLGVREDEMWTSFVMKETDKKVSIKLGSFSPCWFSM